MEEYTREQLKELSEDQKIDLILKLLKRVEELERKVAELQKPGKDSTNSSTPPSHDRKEDKNSDEDESSSGGEESSMGPPEGHKGSSRESGQPDQTIDREPDECNCCGHDLDRIRPVLVGSSQMTVLPPVRTIQLRINRYKKRCPGCGSETEANYPEGWDPKAMFGPRIHRLVGYLKHEQHLSYERLESFFEGWFGLDISEGGVDNILNRMTEEMAEEAEKIRKQVQQAWVIGSDETGARVAGENWWEWVFQTDQYSYHTIVDSRAGSVIDESLPRGSPVVWESDLYSGQMSAPAETFQICMAHQQRELKYAIDCGEPIFASRMKEVFREAIQLNEEIDWREGYTYRQRQKKKRIKQRFWGLLCIETETEEGQKLQERYRRHHDKLFTFLGYEQVSPTNNASERDLRTSVIHRKVTNCFRSEWGARGYAYFKSIKDTAQRAGENIAEKLEETMNYSIPKIEQKLQAQTL